MRWQWLRDLWLQNNPERLPRTDPVSNTMEIQILQSDSPHLATVAQWLFNQWGHKNPNNTIETVIEKLSQKRSSNGLESTFVAIDSSAPIGVCRLTSADMSVKPELSPWLASVFVPPELRHKNIGRSLCEHCFQYAINKDFSQLYLYTPDKEHFYNQMGWQTIEKLNYKNEIVSLMVKDIANK